MSMVNAPPITRAGPGLPSRIIYHGVEGIGKTSWAVNAPRPIFIMTRGETGLLTLIDAGQVPETEHFRECQTWFDFISCLDWLILEQHNYRTVVIDTLNGAQNLCFDAVTAEKYNGNMESFLNFGRGPDIASTGKWLELLSRLDRVRSEKKMAIIALCHTKVKTFKNPEGDDYDRYTPDMHEKIWGASHKWADIVLFGNYETFAKKEKGALKAKGVDAGTRLFYTQRTAAFDAKNRVGLPAEIPMGATSEDAWHNFYEAAKAGRRKLQETNSNQNTDEETT